MLWCAVVALGVLAFTLALGVSVFCAVEHQSLIDGLLNAVMVMTGLGLVSAIGTSLGKALTGCYAIFSAIAFFSVLAILFTPLIHRLLHYFHLEAEEEAGEKE